MTSISPVVLVFMLASLLLLPIEYRAGAQVPHPHTTLQLLAELATGTLHHHGSVRDLHRGGGPPGSVIAADDQPRLTEVHSTGTVAVAPLQVGPSVGSLVSELVAILQWSLPLPWLSAVIIPDPPPPRAHGFSQVTGRRSCGAAVTII